MTSAWVAVLLVVGVMATRAAAGIFYAPAPLAHTIKPGTRGASCPVPQRSDRDGDAIVEGRDKCPTLFAPTAHGCPASASKHVPAPVKRVLEGVNFDNDETALQPEAMAILDQVATSLRQWDDARLEVAGYTDNWGREVYNLNLSQRRAEAVRSYLISKGLAADHLSAKGYGEANPVAGNTTAGGRSQNRRVELVALK